MVSKYGIGQRVKVRPVGDQSLTVHESGIESFSGQTGEVADLYSISPNPGEFFYVYTVRIEPAGRIVVLHEDEIESALV